MFSLFERCPGRGLGGPGPHGDACGQAAVVVKVQRPDVAHLSARDLAAMSWMAPLLVGPHPRVAALANPPALVELFAETIVEELDFRLEADNMLDIAHILAETDHGRWSCPGPIRRS